MNVPKILVFCCLLAALSGCDQLGIETADKVAARVEAEGKAIGGACRHAGRALENCYEVNRRASKAAVYAGWRDMDGYMRENNIAVVKPSQMEDETAQKDAGKDENKAVSNADDNNHKPTEAKVSGTAHGEKPAKATTKTS